MTGGARAIEDVLYRTVRIRVLLLLPATQLGRMGICNDDVYEGAGALSLRERVREARVRVVQRKCSVYYPHPAFGHPLPEGEGSRLVHVTVIANHSTKVARHFILERSDLSLKECLFFALSHCCKNSNISFLAGAGISGIPTLRWSLWRVIEYSCLSRLPASASRLPFLQSSRAVGWPVIHISIATGVRGTTGRKIRPRRSRAQTRVTRRR